MKLNPTAIKLKSLGIWAACALFLSGLGITETKAQTLSIGDDVGFTDQYVPIFSCYGYNFSQQIYLASELVDAGATGPVTITKLAFKAGLFSTTYSSFQNWTVYLAQTNQDEFTMANHWVPYPAFTEVFSGLIPAVIPGEYVEIELSTPFVWDGVSNITVAVDENTPGYSCTQDWYAYYPTSVRGLLYYNDYTNPDPAAPPNANYTSYALAHILFEYEEAPACGDLVFNAGLIEGPAAVCPGSYFTIINTDGIVGTGVTYEWQVRSPAGTGTWTTVAGVEGINYYVGDGIWEDTEYRCIVTCTESGESEMTNEILVTLNPFTSCYCIPESMGCDWDAYISGVTTTGAITDFANTGTLCSGGFYDYFGDYTVTAMQFSEFEIDVDIENSNAGVRIWVDWNQDGSFGIDELVAESSGYISAGGTFSALINVPGTAVPGTTKMRVSAASWATGVDPCMMGGYWGEVEDYAFEVVIAPDCADLVLTSGTLTPIDVCPSTAFSIINTGSTLGAGMTREWQMRSPSGTGEWVTMAGAESVNYTDLVGITEPTDYRCIVSCPASGASDTTDEITVGINTFIDCYCEPIYSSGCTWSVQIDEVVTTGAVTDISNTGTGCSTDGYADYSDSYIVSAIQLQEVTLSVTTAYSYGGIKIWIDYNQDGIFNADEMIASTVDYIPPSTFTVTFMVPLTATPGETKMRIRTGGWTTYFDACEELYDGETEDYGFVVIPAPSCVEATDWPATATSLASPGAVCGTGAVYLNVDEAMPLASGITYQWESSTTGTGGWTAVSPILTSPGYLAEGISTATYFRCNILCEESNYIYSSTIFVESVVPETPTVFDGEHCGPGAVELTASVGSGFVYWYDVPEGGMPFAEGEVISTPEISTTTTYYAAGGAFPPNLLQIAEVGSASSIYSPGPFNISNRKTTMQFLYTAEQLSDAGATAGMIEDMRMKMMSAPSEGIPNYTISLKAMPASTTMLSSWQTTGFTEVYNTAMFDPEETGWQVFTFDNPFFYDGVSALVVQVCWSNVTAFWSYTGSHEYIYAPGQMLYWGSSDAGDACGEEGSWSASELPNAIFKFAGCLSERVPVQAFIRDTPTVQIDLEDGVYCLFNNQINIPTSPSQPSTTDVLWNTGDTDTFLTAYGSGVASTFWVQVTNEWGCVSSDTAHLTLNPSPEVDLGPDTAVCEGGLVLLDAGDDGVDYYWNTSETTRTINVDDGGSYTVLVTNEYGCMGSDTINVTVEGYAPSIDGIIVDNISATTFQFTPLHPENVLDYRWNFGDGSSESLSPNPMHTFPEAGTYYVTLEVTSSCGAREYFTYVTIVLGAEDWELSNSLNVFPNPTDQILNVQSQSNVKMSQVEVINNLGQVILKRDLQEVESFKVDVSQMPAGTYHLRITSDKGQLVKKFQVLR